MWWMWFACAPEALTGADLCDGSAGSPLTISSYGGMYEARDVFLRPYGYTALFVDAQCAWTAVDYDPAFGSWTSAHTGALSAADADALAADLQLGRWSALRTPPDPPVLDGGTVSLSFRDERYTTADDGGFGEVYAAAAQWADDLFPTGAEATADGVRALTWEAPTSTSGWSTSWSGTPLSAWAGDPNVDPGTSVTGAEADALRALRADFLANGDPNGAPIVTDAEGSWVVLVREDLALPVVWFE